MGCVRVKIAPKRAKLLILRVGARVVATLPGFVQTQPIRKPLPALPSSEQTDS